MKLKEATPHWKERLEAEIAPALNAIGFKFRRGSQSFERFEKGVRLHLSLQLRRHNLYLYYFVEHRLRIELPDLVDWIMANRPEASRFSKDDFLTFEVFEDRSVFGLGGRLDVCNSFRDLDRLFDTTKYITLNSILKFCHSIPSEWEAITQENISIQWQSRMMEAYFHIRNGDEKAARAYVSKHPFLFTVRRKFRELIDDLGVTHSDRGYDVRD